MRENILFLLQIITIDFFTAFGLYSILYLIVLIFVKKPILYKIDEEAVKFISLAGVIYFTAWIIGIFVFYAESNPEEQNDLINRLFGKYWFGIWFQPILWFALTQLLRFKKVSKNALLRIVFSFLLIVSIEQFIIFITSFHRDYLPSSWTMYRDLDIYPSNFFLALLIKIMVFLLFVGIYYLVKSQMKKFAINRIIEN
ncbi:molybdopterin-containing oxidoreductase family membrane subunit [Flavobacterium sp. 2755]|uniref:hypothetical protein n=1 Tax=Flavobacterium sp. 2755 TaxID=2817765 RepID=UPI00285C7E00|nr:hypothetical protein [Flavobacterium sp. 2755]MDR6763301.1 molybdopterin-containing oxidoreductase family membrane subunit [Flavobacterium sp. 2755]